MIMAVVSTLLPQNGRSERYGIIEYRDPGKNSRRVFILESTPGKGTSALIKVTD